MFCPTTPAMKSPFGDLLEEDLGELDEIRVRIAVDRRLEVAGLHAEVEEPLGEDLDVTGLVEGLRREEPLARVVGRGVDQPGRRGQCATFADDEPDRGADGSFTLVVVLEQDFRFVFTRLVAVHGVFEVPLWAHLHPPLDRVLREELSHAGTCLLIGTLFQSLWGPVSAVRVFGPMTAFVCVSRARR